MTQTVKTILLSALVSLAVVLTAANWLGWNNRANINIAATESVYDRVMRTKTIRCGYTMRPGYINKDANTGKISGVVHDYVEELGKGLSLKIEWTAEITPGEVPAALDHGIIDLYCVGLWPNAPRARALDMTMPIAKSVMGVYLRLENARQFTDYGQLNDAKLTVAVIDGTAPAQIINRLLPEAKKYSLPQLTPHTDLALAVADGKADFSLIDTYGASEYMVRNTGKLRQLVLSKPFAVFPNSMALQRGQYEFKRMIDIATAEMIGTGAIANIIKQYDHEGGILPAE